MTTIPQKTYVVHARFPLTTHTHTRIYSVFAVVEVDKVVLMEDFIMLEKDIVNAILRYLKTAPQCFAWKTHGGMYGTAGIPDIICCIAGRFVAFEVKQPGGKLTKLQEQTLGRIQAAGGHAYKVTSLQEVKDILQSLEITEDIHG